MAEKVVFSSVSRSVILSGVINLGLKQVGLKSFATELKFRQHPTTVVNKQNFKDFFRLTTLNVVTKLVQPPKIENEIYQNYTDWKK